MTPYRKRVLGLAIITAMTNAPALVHSQTSSSDGSLQIAQATVQTGSLQGRVRDASEGLPLQGAIIRVEGTNYEARTGQDGTYRLPSLPAGSHEIRVSYVGYDSQTVTVDVTAGARDRLDVELPATVHLEGMVVVGYRGAQSRALSQQRASDNIINVVSADTLGDFPDVSVAESVARIAGVAVTRHRGDADAAVIRGGNPAWTRVSVDGMEMPSAGEGRSVALGQMTSEVINAVEVTKAPTPDMDADAIGGTINIVTRGALTSPSIFSAKASGGYSELGSRNNYDAAVGAAYVFGDVHEHGVMMSLSQSQVDRMMNNVENSFTDVDGVWLSDGNIIKDYDIIRTRSAFELRYDFMSASEDTHLYIGYTRSDYKADEDRTDIRFEMRNGFADGSTYEQGTWNGTRVRAGWTDRHDRNVQDLIRFGGSHDFGRVLVDFGGSYGLAENVRKPGRQSWEYRADFPLAMNYDYSNPNFPVLTFADTGEVPRIGTNIDPDDVPFRHGSNTLRERFQEETNIQLMANASMPFDLGDYQAQMKFGAKYVSRDRSNDENRLTVVADGPAMREILDFSTPSNNYGRFPYGYRFDRTAAQARVATVTVEEDIRRQYESDFDISENVYAGYAMSTIDFGAMRLVGGVRVEHTETTSEGFRSLDNWATIPEQTRATNSYTNYFPSLHARYDIGENMVARAAYSTGISRAGFSNLRPTVVVNEISQSLSTGSPDLEPALSQAFDLMLEYYMGPIGVISGGVFSKRIEGVHFGFNRFAEPGEVFNGFVVPGDGWRVSTTVNSERSATINGAEISWDQALTFLPAPFDGLGVFANYTYTDSKGRLPGTGESVPLGEQPQDTVNLAVYYEAAGFSTRLAYNYQSSRVRNFGDGRPESFLLWDDRSILDLTARYRFNENFQIFLEASNLTDSRQARFIGVPTRVDELEEFGRQYMVGVRVNF